jgi:glycerophosphoryl diester phosphodiesterase
LLVHGHRGARARFPENTIPGFEYAIAQGVDAIEMDLAVTRDDVIVISHDPVLASGAAIRQLRFEEAHALLPSLDDVFQLSSRSEFDFNLEIKSFPEHPEYSPAPGEFSRMVLEKIRAYRLEKRAIVQSFDFRTLTAMRELAPEIRLGALMENDSRDFPAASAAAANAEIVAPHFPLVTTQKVAEAHRAGLQVIVWTVNEPLDWNALIDAGVDGIITDDPAALIAYLHR